MKPRGTNDANDANDADGLDDAGDDLRLPPADGDARDDAVAPLDADADLAPTAEKEEVGLDTAQGLDEPLEAELDVSDVDEATGWSAGDETENDLDADADHDLGAGEEYGWTDQNETSDDADLDDGIETEDADAETPADRGEEGLDDDTGEGDVAALPPLDADPDDDGRDDDAFAIEILREQSNQGPSEPKPRGNTR